MARSAALVRQAYAAGVMIVAAALTAGCGSGGDQEVRDYVENAIAAMGDGLYADTPGWQNAVAEAKPDLLAEATIADTYRGLDGLAVVAGGRHSRFVPPSEVAGNDGQYGPGRTFLSQLRKPTTGSLSSRSRDSMAGRTRKRLTRM